MDRARQKTDRMLEDMERRVKAVYANDPSLLRIQKKYAKYMARVERLTRDDYRRFQDATDTDTREELKKVYTGKIEALTIGSSEYQRIVSEFTSVLAIVNQKALDVVNAEMADIYAINYNQVATVCRKIGIEVNGEEESRGNLIQYRKQRSSRASD